jgi:hypothetical protein
MASDDAIREELLGQLCEMFKESNWHFATGANDLCESAGQNLSGADSDDARYQLKRLSDNFVVDHTPALGGNGTVEITARTIEEYEQLSNTEVVPDDDCVEVLGLLYESERDSPRQPDVTRDEMLDQTSVSDDELDRTIWYLNRKGFIDARTHLGNPPYNSAKITDRGRQTYELKS